MLRRLGLALVVLLMACGYALAQPINRLCVQAATGGGCTVVSAANPLPTTAAITPGGTQDVNLTQILGAATAVGSGTSSGALRVELPTNGTGVVGLAAGANTIGALTANQSVNLTQILGSAAVVGSGTSTGALRVELPTNGTGLVGLNAGQNKIGNIGNSTKQVCVAPTTTSATYAANVVVGGLLTFSNLFTSTGSGIIQSVSINFNTVQTVGFKLYPFNANPSNTTWTEHSAAAINSADIFKVEPYLTLSNADSGLGTMTNYALSAVGQTYVTGGTSGFFILVPVATTATLGGTSNTVQVCVSVLQDL